MSIIGTFFAIVRKTLLAIRIKREISQRIIPHIKGRVNHGYPFSSKDELHLVRLKSSTGLSNTLHALEAAAFKMPEAECNAFLYIVNRDLEEQMRAYLEYANTRKFSYELQKLRPAPTAA